MKPTNQRAWLAVAVSAAFLVPLAVFGAPALAKSASSASEYEYGGSSQYQYKVTICHKTHSEKHPFVQIRVSKNAVKAHMRHHDLIAPCPTPPGKHDDGNAGTNDHGKSGDDHGKSGDDHGKSGDDHGKSGDDHGKSGDEHGNGNGKGHRK